MIELSAAEIIDLIERHGREGRQRITEAAVPDKIEKVCEALQKAESSRVRQVLCNILASLAQPEALPCLVLALKDQDADVMAAAADAIGNCAAGREVDESLRSIVGTKLLELTTEAGSPKQVKSASLYALGLMRFRPALQAVVGALDDPLPTIRRCAAEALSYIADPAAVDAMKNRYRKEADAGVRRYIEIALKSLETDK